MILVLRFHRADAEHCQSAPIPQRAVDSPASDSGLWSIQEVKGEMRDGNQ